MESVHLVSFCIVDATGVVLKHQGEIESPVFLRSAAKPLIATALIRAGATKTAGLTSQEIAIASGSHWGQALHLECIEGLLARNGLSESALLCGATAPKDEAAAHRIIRAGSSFLPIHNNCSGQHAALACFASTFPDEVPYIESSHPIHAALDRIIQRIFRLDVDAAPKGVDGCGLPTLAFSLRDTARAFALFSHPSAFRSEDAEAIETVTHAMTEHPEYVGGGGSFDTALMRASPDILSKSGAEAFYSATVMSKHCGIAVKVHDGSPRALPVAIRSILEWLGACDERTSRAIEPFLGPIRNASGAAVGNYEVLASD